MLSKLIEECVPRDKFYSIRSMGQFLDGTFSIFAGKCVRVQSGIMLEGRLNIIEIGYGGIKYGNIQGGSKSS